MLTIEQIDWLHSPTARDTMSRLLVKYQRFIQIMSANPDKVTVPTLDVDLAWHTQQLSPRCYYDYTVAKTQKFVDHDDKINEDKLATAFEWTSKTYQELFGEVYSECTCWYCESVRTSHISSVGKLLGVSRNEKSKYRLQRISTSIEQRFAGCTDHTSLQYLLQLGSSQHVPAGRLSAHLVPQRGQVR
jgi:hypothetical protein